MDCSMVLRIEMWISLASSLTTKGPATGAYNTCLPVHLATVLGNHLGLWRWKEVARLDRPYVGSAELVRHGEL